MPLAYLLLCHRMPGAVADLLRAVWRPEHVYVLHADAKAGAALHATVARLADALPNVHVLPPNLCSWGGWSLVRTLLHGIAFAVARDARWSHLIPLSEGHVPLCAPEDAEAALLTGVSRIEATRVAELYPSGQADVRHRFRARYRELPGVGMLPTAPQALAPDLEESLHHASQWLVLAREACERLQSAGAESPIWAPFRESLIADETALPTLLLGTDLGAGLAIDRRPTTFVAWPHLSGTEDWTFSEANFFAARGGGLLFIRKRPRLLPPRVAAALAALAVPAPWPELPAPDERFARSAEVVPFAGALYAALRDAAPGLVLETLQPETAGGSAACYLRLRCPGLPEVLRVALLSEDFVTFKVLLVWLGEAETHDLRTLGGLPTWLLKVRLFEIFTAREILLPEPPDFGFVTLAPGEGFFRLTAMLRQALAAGLALAPALAAT